MITQSCMNYARLSNLVFSICKDQINQGLWVFRNSCLFIYKLFHVICDGKRLQQSACGTSSQSINSFASETNLILEWLVDTNIVTLAKFGEIYAITCRETYFWNNFLEEKHPSYRLDTSWTQAHVIYCVLKIFNLLLWLFFPEIRCPIQSVTNAEVPTGNCTTVELSYGTRCSYYCRRGYERSGSETITCQLDKTWSPSAPICNRKHMVLIPTCTHRCKMFDLRNLRQFFMSLIDDKMSSKQASGSPTNAQKSQIACINEESTSKFDFFLYQPNVIVNIFSRLVIGSWSQEMEFHWL